MIKEIWKDVENYEGLYQISNFGRVKSLKFGKEKILKPGKKSAGYLFVKLCKNGNMKNVFVHRLVALAFIENPENLPEVNHKDENKENNWVDNLEFCTRSYNINFGTRNSRMLNTKKLNNAKTAEREIDQYTKDGFFIKTWRSSREAERYGFFQSAIIACCRKRRKSHGDYVWQYHEDIL